MTVSVPLLNSLKKKILLVLSSLGIVLAISTFTILRQDIVPAFKKFEAEESRTNLSRVEQAIQGQYQTLSLYTLEYAWWNDVYDTVNQPDVFPDFVDENIFYPDFWEQVDIGMMLFFDVHGQLAWGGIIDPKDREISLPVAENWNLLTTKDHPLIKHESDNSKVFGLISSPYGLMLVTSHTILRTDESGPRMGSVVVGRFLTRELAKKIGKASSVQVKFYPVFDPDLPDPVKNAISVLSNTPNTSLTEHTTGLTFTRKLILSVDAAPLVLVEVRTGRTIGAIGVEAINTTLVFMALTIVLFVYIAWKFLSMVIVEPAVSLTKQISRIRQTRELSSVPMTGRNDEFGVLANEFDQLVNELAESEIKLKTTRDQALQMADTKGKFLATMSHEIRTPMNGVLGMADILQQTDLDPNQHSLVHNIQDSGRLLLDVINDILDYSKIESGNQNLELKEFNLRNLLDETLNLMAIQAREKNLKLERIFPVTIDQRLIGDRNRISQLLINLVGNAIKFTDQGGCITKVTVSQEDADRVVVFIEISDTGVGVSKEQQERIFEEFSQADDSSNRQFQGSGLGLSISKKLLDLMDGEIGLESEPGKGACFWFRLPLQKAEYPYSEPHPLDLLQGLHALIVDDNHMNLEILGQQLSRYGMSSSSADSGSSALAELKNAIEQGKPCDLALIGWNTPGMAGLEAAREIRADTEFDGLPIIALSPALTGDERLISSDIYIDRYLTRPVSEPYLYGCLVDLLGKRQKIIERSQTHASETKTNNFDFDVLLVEDNRINQEVGRLMLEKIGCRITVAENGVEALAALDKQPYDLIFMDCHMPELDGFKATTLIRDKEDASQSRIPIIALTADVIEGVREKCLDAGMDDYITKPFSWSQLQETLQTWLPSNEARP